MWSMALQIPHKKRVKDRKRETELESLQDAMLDHALLAGALQGQRSSGNGSQGISAALGTRDN